MKRLAFFIIVIVCTGIVSCGIQRQSAVQQESDATYSTTACGSSSLEESVKNIVEKMMSESVEKLLEQDLKVVHESFSPPDSTGSQYLKERTVAHLKTNLSENKGSTEISTEYSDEHKDSLGISSENNEMTTQSEIFSAEKTGLEWWQKALIWCGAAAVLVISVRIAVKFILKK